MARRTYTQTADNSPVSDAITCAIMHLVAFYSFATVAQT